MLKTLYLIRHGQPKLGTGIAYDRVPGPPLDEHGETEARAAGGFLASLGIERLYASPLDRTQRTAALIGEITGLQPTVEPDLAEHRNDETFDAVKTRMRELFARIDALEFATVGFVTHGSPIKALLQILSNDQINLTPYAFPGGNHAPTAGIWCARWRESAWQLELVFEPRLTST
jgi:2,3-bisphosphoglycerate-dependent phosphoglycerate mutase